MDDEFGQAQRRDAQDGQVRGEHGQHRQTDGGRPQPQVPHPGELRAHELEVDPIAFFRSWFDDAVRSVAVPDRMTLATVDGAGRPDARMVLLKGVDERGFRFFTNYEGRKAGQLLAHPDAALVMHWHEPDRQVRVRGTVEKLSGEESDTYFASRDRLSQLGAWASAQSRPVADRDELEDALAAAAERFGGLTEGNPVPRPPHWGGYLVRPREIEFWQGRLGRFHDRFLYTREDPASPGAHPSAWLPSDECSEGDESSLHHRPVRN